MLSDLPVVLETITVVLLMFTERTNSAQNVVTRSISSCSDSLFSARSTKSSALRRWDMGISLSFGRLSPSTDRSSRKPLNSSEKLGALAQCPIVYTVCPISHILPISFSFADEFWYIWEMLLKKFTFTPSFESFQSRPSQFTGSKAFW